MCVCVWGGGGLGGRSILEKKKGVIKQYREGLHKIGGLGVICQLCIFE